MKKCILGTVLIAPQNIKRYVNWINYYGLAFPEHDLILGNDGGDEALPFANEILRQVDKSVKDRVKFLYFGPFLGRVSHCVFPGWRRSFKEILKFTLDEGYERVIFIETDLYIRKKYMNKYKDLFEEDIYAAGWSAQHNMMETSLQVLNDKKIREDLVAFFTSGKELMSNVCAEPQIQSAFKPILDRTKGTRLEGNYGDIDSWEFYAQCDYELYKKHIEEA